MGEYTTLLSRKLYIIIHVCLDMLFGDDINQSDSCLFTRVCDFERHRMRLSPIVRSTFRIHRQVLGTGVD